MKKRIRTYRNRIDELLAAGETPDHSELDWKSIKAEHLVQIAFFQHERLIHLIVTITFALLEMLALILTFISASFGTILLVLMILLLLVPYISHYFLLENEVQKMYEQYDRIHEHSQKPEIR